MAAKKIKDYDSGNQFSRPEEVECDTEVGRRAPKPGQARYNPNQPAVDLTANASLDNVSSPCPCGHGSVMHGVGLGGTNNPGACEIKGCMCSGFGNKPGQGYGWQYEYESKKD